MHSPVDWREIDVTVKAWVLRDQVGERISRSGETHSPELEVHVICVLCHGIHQPCEPIPGLNDNGPQQREGNLPSKIRPVYVESKVPPTTPMRMVRGALCR